MAPEPTVFLIVPDGIYVRMLVKFTDEFFNDLQERVGEFMIRIRFSHTIRLYINRNELIRYLLYKKPGLYWRAYIFEGVILPVNSPVNLLRAKAQKRMLLSNISIV